MENQPNMLPDIEQTQVLNAPIAKVWTAVSTAEGIGAWFMPNDLKPEVGHEFHLDAGPYGKSPCKVTEVDPPNRLSFRWGQSWTLTFQLEELDAERTRFTLVHGGWGAEGVTEFGEPHEVVRERMGGGWVGIAQKLKKVIEG